MDEYCAPAYDTPMTVLPGSMKRIKPQYDKIAGRCECICQAFKVIDNKRYAFTAPTQQV